MFGNILKKARKVVDETEQIDERFYGQVIDELSTGYKDKALVGKAIAQSDGTETKFDSIYMKLRAKALQDNAIKSMKLEEKIHLLNKKEQEDIKYSINKRLKTSYFSQLFKNEISSKGYTIPFFSTDNLFKKNGKTYYGKIDYDKMRYVLVNENNEYKDYFPFDVK